MSPIVRPVISLIFLLLCSCGKPQSDISSKPGDPTSPAQEQGGIIISPSNPGSLQAGIQAAWAAGLKKVVVPPGIYRIPRQEGSHWHLAFVGMKDFEIEAAGATFVFMGRDRRGILFDGCVNVTFRGATLLREVPPFSQGKIVAIGPDRRSIDVKIDSGYPVDLDDTRDFPTIPVLNVYLKNTRRLKPAVPSLYTTDERRGGEAGGPAKIPTFERLDTGLFRFHLRAVPSSVPIAEGDPVAWRGQNGSEFDVWQCSGMHFDDITIKSAAGMAFEELFGDGGNRYSHCVLTYAPPPAGASESPLLASSADAFNSGGVRHGPLLDNCLFEGANDDDINIHGNYALVVETNGSHVVVDGRKSHRDLLFARSGDHLRFYDRRGALLAEALAVSVVVLPDYTPKGSPPFVSPVFVNDKKASYLDITLDRPVSAEIWGTVANANALGSGFLLRACNFRNNRAHGIFIRGSDGIIEDCVVEGTENAGILISPEMTAWCNEGDYAHNVIVRGNTIRNVAIGCSQPSNSGLTVDGFEYGHIVPLPGGHRNIEIRNNLFEDDPDTNIIITSAIGVIIEGNHFVRPMSMPPLHGADVGANPTSLIWVRQANNVKVKDNVVISPGKYYKQAVDADVSATADGFNQGVTVEK